MSEKVAFVEPMGAQSNVFSRFMKIPLLGPVYLATIAKDAGYDASVLNENILGRKISPEELKSIDTLCVSAITATANKAKEMARQYRQINPKGKTIIGGIHSSMMPEDFAGDFDQVFVGEGEDVILDVLSGNIEDKIIYGKRIENLDKLPFPDFTLIKNGRKIKTYPVMTSRGCPYDCNFCSVTEMFGRGYRTQSPERIMEEISRYKKGTIFFADDHFVANPKRTNILLDMMLEQGFNRPWSTQVRADIAKDYPEIVEKMSRAGCHTVYVGFESINPESLKEINKRQTVEDIEHSIKVFHENRIMIHGMFMFGTDSDKKNNLRETLKFSCKNKIDSVQFLALTPLPGTKLYKKLEKEGRILHKQWELYDALHVVFQPKNMSPYELQQGIIDCFEDFYSYLNALNEGLNTFMECAVTGVERLYKKVNWPSFRPSLIKIAGKKIVKEFIAQNRGYFSYLLDLSRIHPEGI